MTPQELIDRLPSMTVVQLRELARAEKLPVTYLSQRARPDLVALITEALNARG